MRRETIGITLVALTVSSVLTAFIAGEKPSDVVELVENSYPTEIREDQWNSFSIVVVARRPLEYLDLEFSCLHEVRLFGPETTAGKSEREALLSLSPVSYFVAMAQALGVEPVEFAAEVMVNKTKHDAYVIDFSDLLRASMDDPVFGDYFGHGAHTIYAGIFDDTGVILLYAGIKDFFHGRNITITEMSLSLNDDKRTFKRARDMSPSDRAAGAPTLLDAPAVGTLRFTELRNDDTVRLAFSLDSSAAGHSRYLQIVRLFANGQLEEDIANYLPRAQ